MAQALPSNIIQARERARQAESTAGQFTAALPTIGDVLNKRVNQLFQENQDILGEFSSGVADLVSAPGKSFELFSDVTDPFARERLASEFVGTQAQAPLTQAGLLGQRMGRISDIVEAGTGAFTAQATQIANAAERARQTYMDLLDEFKTMEDIRLREAAIAASRASSGSSGQLSEKDKIQMQQAKSAAKGALLSAIQAGEIKAGHELDAGILAAGFNIGDSFFKDLYNQIPSQQAPQTQRRSFSIPERFNPISQISAFARDPGTVIKSLFGR